MEVRVIRTLSLSLRRLWSARLPRRTGVLVVVVSLVAAGLYAADFAAPTGAMAATASAGLLPAAGQYFSAAPVKVMDTRDGTGGVSVAPLAAGATASFPVEGVGEVPSSGVTDVYVVINAISPAASGCLHDYDADISDPGICTVSFQAGQSVSDSDIVQVGDAGYMSVTNSSSGTADVAVTVLGYYQDGDSQTAGQTYIPLAQSDIVDTRSGLGAPEAQIPSGGSLTVQVAGEGGIPSDAAGAALFIGAANATQAGYVSAYPAGGASSSLAILSYSPARTIHDLYFGALSAGGQLTLVNQGPVPVDLMVGVQGYLVSPSAGEAGGAYQDVPESRIVDTRSGTGGVPATPVPAGGSITFTATGGDGVPATGVSSVAESVAALNATGNGYLSVYPAGASDPQQPGVNFNTGDSQDNDMSAPLLSSVSPTGRETVTNHSSGTVDIVVSVRGYYAAATMPSAPTQVDAGNQSGTATIYWGMPLSDGGAAITSYTVTIYNSDGSVNQTVPAGPTATTITATGLSGTATYSVGIQAANAVGAGSPATAPMNIVPAGWTAPSSSEADYAVVMDIDPSTGNETFESATSDEQTYAPDGTLTSSTTDAPASTTDLYSGLGIGTYACVLNAQGGVTAHKPWHDYADDPERTFDFFHETYTAPNARQLYGGHGKYYTFQDMLCSTGGGQSKGNYHLWFSGTAVTLAQKSEYEIGKQWGTGQSSSTEAISLNFQLAAGPASVGASVGVSPGVGTYGGDIGSDGRFTNYPGDWNQYKRNRVNAFFVSPHRWPWDGTNSYEGNTSEVLYEWPMGTTGILRMHTYGTGVTFYVSPG